MKIKKKKITKPTAQETTTASTKKPKEKKKMPDNNVGLYLYGGKLIQITWETHTDKQVKANAETKGTIIYHDSPLPKSKVYNQDEKLQKMYNELTEKVQEIQSEQLKILKKLGLKYPAE